MYDVVIFSMLLSGFRSGVRSLDDAVDAEVQPLSVSRRAAASFLAAMCRSSTEYIDSAPRTQQVLCYLTLIRRRRRTATAAASGGGAK